MHQHFETYLSPGVVMSAKRPHSILNNPARTGGRKRKSMSESLFERSKRRDRTTEQDLWRHLGRLKSAMDWLMLYMEWIGKVGGAVTMERFREKSKQLAALAVKAMASADRCIAQTEPRPMFRILPRSTTRTRASWHWRWKPARMPLRPSVSEPPQGWRVPLAPARARMALDKAKAV